MPSMTAFPAPSRLRPAWAACLLPGSVPSRTAPSSIAVTASLPCPAAPGAAAHGLPARWANGNAMHLPRRCAWTAPMCFPPTTGPSPTRRTFSISARSRVRRGSTAAPPRVKRTSPVPESAPPISPSINTWRCMAPGPRRTCRSRPVSPCNRPLPPILPARAPAIPGSRKDARCRMRWRGAPRDPRFAG
jgi:hypothetical protein